MNNGKMHYYAGIGARKTPEEVLVTFKEIGRLLAEKGYVLRSGAADGADSAFEEGCAAANGLREIYLPWPNFNGSNSAYTSPSNEAMSLAEHHWRIYGWRTWEDIPDSHKKLLARDVHQALGQNLKSPSDFVVCYTNGGKLVGGTAMAIHIANDRGIRVFNAGIYAGPWTGGNDKRFVEEVMRYAELSENGRGF